MCNKRIGFYYPNIDVCKVIECEVVFYERVQVLYEFEEWLSIVLYILNERWPAES